MSEVKVNKISPRTNCGTVQLGDSGDTITIPAGATITNNGTQTGFGRTGTVDWDTTAKTASFTAVSGNGYFVNTTSSAITLTLPASPSAGDIVAFKDYAFTFATNNLTVDGNGSPIGGVDGTVNPTYDTNGTSKTFIYVDGTKGWLVTNESTDTSQEEVPTYIVATGGTITCCGDYKIHTFTGPGTFAVSCAGNASGSNTVDYLVVAGGGGGGSSVTGYYAGGGGGAGGFRESVPSPAAWTASPIANPGNARPVTATSFPITVGGGGAGGAGPGSCSGVQGSNSIFSDIISTGGGYGGKSTGVPGNGVAGGPGGSGGGGGAKEPGGANIGGTGNTPPVSPAQGFNGGNGSTNTSGVGGGGGGALGVGDTGTSQPYGQVGGPGATTCISGSPLTKAVGGATGCQPGGTPTTAANSGNGGQSGGNCSPSGANGGSGIVIIRYKFQN